MANKRQLKKAICRTCGDLAGVCLTHQADGTEENLEKWDDLVVEAAMLQVKALSRANVRFGEKVKSFPNPRAYRKARRKFYKTQMKELFEFMNTNTEDLINRINELRK